MIPTRLFARAVAIAAAGIVTAGFIAGESMALDDARFYVFVPNRASADIAVIDTRTDLVVSKIDVGHVPHQVAVSRDLDKIVVTNTADDTLSIIDLASLAVEATVPLDNEPEHMALSPNGDVVAVGNIGSGTVSFVSLVSGVETARTQGLFEPHNMTFSADGLRLYVGNLGANFVSVVDVPSGKVVEEISIGAGKAVASLASDSADYQGIINVTRTPDGRLGFAAYGEGDQMAVIDLSTSEVIRTLELGDLPWRAFSTSDGRFMLVPNNGDRTVSVFSTETLEEVARLPGGEDMTGINTAMFDTLAYVISRGEDKAIVLDLTTMQRIGEVALPSSPETGVVTPDGRKLYVALSGSDQVAVIDTVAMTLIEMIGGVGEEPWGAHMVGALNYCH